MSDPKKPGAINAFTSDEERRGQMDENLAVQGQPEPDDDDPDTEEAEHLSDAAALLDNPDAEDMEDGEDEDGAGSPYAERSERRGYT